MTTEGIQALSVAKSSLFKKTRSFSPKISKLAEGPWFHKLKKTLFQKWMDFGKTGKVVKDNNMIYILEIWTVYI